MQKLKKEKKKRRKVNR